MEYIHLWKFKHHFVFLGYMLQEFVDFLNKLISVLWFHHEQNTDPTESNVASFFEPSLKSMGYSLWSIFWEKTGEKMYPLEV